MTITIHEWKINYKTFLVWFIAVALFCAGCMCLFPVIGDSMDGMDEAFSSMGAFTQAFGLDKLSMASVEGFFATEVGNIYPLGGSMFAALLGIGLLSKEEDKHTAEFLYTLPVGRISVFFQKYVALAGFLLLFSLLNTGVFIASFYAIGEEMPWRLFLLYMGLQFLLQLEIASVCYLISALSKRIQTGLGLGLTLVFYMLDIISRITEEMEFLKYCTPFYYANASSIFITDGDVDMALVGISLAITFLCVTAASIIFKGKDLSC